MPRPPGRRRCPARARTRRGERQGCGAKAWLLLCLPFGLTTFAAFLYIGIRAHRPRWLVWPESLVGLRGSAAAVYGATSASVSGSMPASLAARSAASPYRAPSSAGTT